MRVLNRFLPFCSVSNIYSLLLLFSIILVWFFLSFWPSEEIFFFSIWSIHSCNFLWNWFHLFNLPLSWRVWILMFFLPLWKITLMSIIFWVVHCLKHIIQSLFYCFVWIVWCYCDGSALIPGLVFSLTTDNILLLLFCIFSFVVTKAYRGRFFPTILCLTF